MNPSPVPFEVIVIGGGHAGAEAAWTASRLGVRTALITMDPTRIGAMSCNPAIGGLAKGQMVREIDALGGLMGLATDATGIQFRMLNASKGPAVQGPRAQCDKYRYAREVQRLLATCPNLSILAGTVERILVDAGRAVGVVFTGSLKPWRGDEASPSSGDCCGRFGDDPADAQQGPIALAAGAVVLTTGTFMRALMHTGERQTPGGRVGEGSAVGISASLAELGFDIGRLKTGTPPRLDARTIDWDDLELQPGDEVPVPFSDLTAAAAIDPAIAGLLDADAACRLIARRFPVQEQKPCHLTHTSPAIHQLIRDNLHRAPMFNGQIHTTGPRYCPSIEDKVVRFADRDSHHVYLEPESLETHEIYCNGISTSLPADVQEQIVRHMPGCSHAAILRPGYAVEYDMVWPHQIDATTMTKRVAGLFLAGQINGTSGYEEAAGQGLLAGLNAVRLLRGQPLARLRRDQSYIGVLMDDLVTKTPREPYRMFTSRAEHRLMLRGDNADRRLTPLGREWGTVDDLRWNVFQAKRAAVEALRGYLESHRVGAQRMIDWARRPEVTVTTLLASLDGDPLPEWSRDPRLMAGVLADVRYQGYIDRQAREVLKLAEQDESLLPVDVDYAQVAGLRNEARHALTRFRPATLGQAGRLAGVTPADLMLLSVSFKR